MSSNTLDVDTDYPIYVIYVQQHTRDAKCKVTHCAEYNEQHNYVLKAEEMLRELERIDLQVWEEDEISKITFLLLVQTLEKMTADFFGTNLTWIDK